MTQRWSAAPPKIRVAAAFEACGTGPFRRFRAQFSPVGMTLSRFCLSEGKARFLAEKAREKWSTRRFRDWLSMPSLTGPGSCFEAYPALTSWAKICRRCGGC
jgi:hypothetical protein